MTTVVDVVVVGGGPAGLAAAIGMVQRGLSVVLLEKQTMPRDKACGEGILPAGVRRLDALGVLSLLDPAFVSPLRGVRYVQEDGSSVEAPFAGAAGLGVRRVALVDAMAARARQVGVDLRPKCPLLAYTRTRAAVAVTTPQGEIQAKMLVAADGLTSPLRRREGLDGPPARRQRFGLRQHVHCAPWSDFVEVHLAEGVEAYVTPVGSERVGIAFLWEGRDAQPVSIAHWLQCFPALAERIAGFPVDSSPRGAGPFARRTRELVRDRFALVGDAAGYLDAITGEGISLALTGAEALAETLPRALRHGANAQNLRPYARAAQRAYLPYWLSTQGVLYLARHVTIRRRCFAFFSRYPAVLRQIVQVVAG